MNPFCNKELRLENQYKLRKKNTIWCWLYIALGFVFPCKLTYKFIEGRNWVILIHVYFYWYWAMVISDYFFAFAVYFNFSGSKIWIEVWNLSARLLKLTINVILPMKPWELLKYKGNFWSLLLGNVWQLHRYLAFCSCYIHVKVCYVLSFLFLLGEKKCL